MRSLLGQGKHLGIPLLIMIVLPIASIFLLCYTFGDGVITEAPFAIIDQDNSSLSRTIVRQIEENDMFDVKYYGDTASELKEQIEQNNVVAGIIIPLNFSVDVTAGNSPSILVAYDGCQMSVIALSKVRMTEVLTTLRVAASIQILEGRLDLQPEEALVYAQPISNTVRYLGNPERSIGNYVLPGTLGNIVQLVMYAFMLEAIRKEEGERIHPLLYNLFGTVVSTAVLLSGIYIMHHIFGIPMLGDWKLIALLGALNMFIIGNVAAILRLVIPQKVFAVQLGSIIMATLLFSGYTFPSLGMPVFFQMVAKWLPFTYFAIPMRDVMYLGSTMMEILPNVHWLLTAAAVTTVPVILLWLWYAIFSKKQLEQQMLTQIQNDTLPTEEQEVASV